MATTADLLRDKQLVGAHPGSVLLARGYPPPGRLALGSRAALPHLVSARHPSRIA